MSLAIRGAFAIGVSAALMTGLPSPASAEPDDVAIGVFVNDVIVAAGSDGTTEQAVVIASTPVVLHGFTVKVDFSALSGVAIVSPSGIGSGCAISTSAFICESPVPVDISGNTPVLPEIAVKPDPGASAGSHGELTVTISANDLPEVSTSATVRVGEGADLGGGPGQELSGSPGDALPTALEVHNVGTTTADGAVAVFYGVHALIATDTHSNCSYSNGSLVACVFDEQLAAGTSYRADQLLPLALRADTSAPGRWGLEISWMTVAEFALLVKEVELYDPAFPGEPGTGAELDLVEVLSAKRSEQADPRPGDNWTMVEITVTGDNPVDLAAIGASASGEQGSVVSLQLGLKNRGQATIDTTRTGESPGAVTIELPPGASLVEMPDSCTAWTLDGPDADPGNLAASSIVCWHDEYLFLAGTQKTFPVRLRIDQVINNATGKVEVDVPGCDTCLPDDKPAGNTAAIVLNAKGGSLPVTGVRIGSFAGAGGTLVAVGMLVLLLTRRRRISAVR